MTTDAGDVRSTDYGLRSTSLARGFEIYYCILSFIVVSKFQNVSRRTYSTLVRVA